LLQLAAEFGILGLGAFIISTVIALTRSVGDGPIELSIRVLLAFSLLNAMVTGDILSDRATLGLLMLVLAMEPMRRTSPVIEGQSAHGQVQAPGAGTVPLTRVEPNPA
jgi:hypothetical protein